MLRLVRGAVVAGALPAACPTGTRVERLARYRVELSDGHEVGVTVGGRGMPLLMAHGISVSSRLYVQSLARLAALGFKVFAVDLAGHGGSAALPRNSLDLAAHAGFLGRVATELGIRRAVLAGHSLGGRLVAEVAAERPDLAAALLLVDAPVGRPWDDLVALARWSPPLLTLLSAILVGDTVTTLVAAGPRQGRKLAHLAAGDALANLRLPWRVAAAGTSVLLGPRSDVALDRLARARVPVVLLHGSRDPVVPLSSAQDAARRTSGELVVVRKARHSWLLEHPDTLRAIVSELLEGRLGAACRSSHASPSLEPGSLAERLGAGQLGAGDPGAPPTVTIRRPEAPRFSWSVRSFAASATGTPLPVA